MDSDSLRAIASILISLFNDAYLYGYCYEHKLLGNKDPTGIFKDSASLSNIIFYAFKPVIKFLFIELPFRGEKWVPLYRLLIQWPLDAAALYYSFQAGIIPFIGMLIFIFLTSKEFGFYVLLGQFQLAKGYDDQIIDKIPFWLESPYFIFCYTSYSYEKFKCFSIIGTVILIISYFLNLIFIK